MNSKRLRTLLLFLFMFLIGSAGFSQEQSREACKQAGVLVGIRDKRGAFVPSLGTADFRARLGQRELRVLSVGVASIVPRVVLAVDLSGSMASKADAVQQVAKEILSSFPRGTDFGLIAFSDHILLQVDFGHSRRELLDSLIQLKPKVARTALMDALNEAVAQLRQAKTGDSVIVVSDGGDNGSKISSGKLRNAYASEGIRLIAVVLRDHHFQTEEEFRTEEERQGFYDLQQLATDSGGSLLIIENPKQIPRVTGIPDDLFQYYRLDLQAGQPERSRLHVEVLSSSGKPRKDLKLSFPSELAANCGD